MKTKTSNATARLAGGEVPNQLPQRARAIVKSWYDVRNFGFFLNPGQMDRRDIFCHVSKIPFREGLGKMLIPGEVADVTFIQDEQGRLVATQISFPENA